MKLAREWPHTHIGANTYVANTLVSTGGLMASSIVLNIPHASTYLPLWEIPAPYHEPASAAYWSCGGKDDMRERRWKVILTC